LSFISELPAEPNAATFSGFLRVENNITNK